MMSYNVCSPRKCYPFIVYALIAVIISVVLMADSLPIRINLTASMPRGLYLISQARDIHVGDFVMVCLGSSLSHLALQRHYLLAGCCENGTQPLLKQIVGQARDRVVLNVNLLTINGHYLPHSATFIHDSLNRLLPTVPRGTYTLKTNQFWIYGTESTKSWDSRYFGAVDCSQIVAIVKPLWVLSRRNEQ